MANPAHRQWIYMSSRVSFCSLRLIVFTVALLLPACSAYSSIYGRRSLLQSSGTPSLVFLPESASANGAVCLDGSLPAYMLEEGSGSGQDSWIVHLEGGGWCGTQSDCLQRSTTDLGSSSQMTAYGLGGILSSSSSENPGFFNWNRVLVRYCDGGAFSGNADYSVDVTGDDGQTHALYFRGQRVWEAVIDDLLSKGMAGASKAILSGDSAGGQAAFFHCNQFQQMLPSQAEVKCLSDAGFFMDIPNIAGEYSFRTFFSDIVALHNINILPEACTSNLDVGQCFFPQYNLGSLQVPIFLLQSSYDSFQVQYILAPPVSYANGGWDACRQSLGACSTSQLTTIDTGLRGNMLAALHPIVGDKNWGLFMPSCYYHTESDDQNLWDGITTINSMNNAQAFSEWFFQGTLVQDIDCEYPCNPNCASSS